MIAQTGGIAAASGDVGGLAHQGRLAAIGGFKFTTPAGPNVRLEIRARVAGRLGRLIKIDGEVIADGVKVASGNLTLVAGRSDAL
jgi:3-hydroxymyristoyl/3-hydroxydecanoyl-(acyl carrier protein) dehydratase